MSGILLLFAIAAIAVVMFWYVFDEAVRRGDGSSGILGMIGDKQPNQDTAAPNWRAGKGDKTDWRRRS